MTFNRTAILSRLLAAPALLLGNLSQAATALTVWHAYRGNARGEVRALGDA